MNNRVLLDARPLFMAHSTRGVGAHTRGLLKALSKENTHFEFEMLVDDGYVGGDFLGERTRGVSFRPRRKSLFLLRHQVVLPFEIWRGKFDIFHSFEPTSIPFSASIRIMTVYDAIPMVLSHDYRGGALSRMLRTIQRRSVARANQVIVNSESSKKDVVRYYGVTEEKIAVVYPGVDEVFHPVADQREFGRIEKQYGITRKYLIYVGSYQTEDKRKNVKFLLELVQYLNMNSRETWNLVLVGKKGVFADTLCRQAELLGVGNRVVFTDYVPDSDLAVILSNAECLLFPSLYEGFGLPLLEAMACGTPVVTFGNSSLREVVGDCGVIVGENSLDEFRLATLSLLSDNARLSILRQKGQEQARRFSWASAAQKVLAIYEHQLEERGDVSHRN